MEYVTVEDARVQKDSYSKTTRVNHRYITVFAFSDAELMYFFK